MDIIPEGEPIRKAVKWISDKRKYEQADNLNLLIDQAGLRFNLSPKDMDYLLKLLTDKQ